MSYSPIIVIAGPTATGKTNLAIQLAKEFSGYIINADSRQIYRELSIGTDRPSEEKIRNTGIPHYLFGHRSIHEKYSIFEYQKEVKKILEENKDKVAFLVGGTGLYIDSIVYNYKLEKNRQRADKLNDLSIEELQKLAGERLSELNQSDRNNPRRLIRFIQKDYQNPKQGQHLKHLYLIYYRNFNEIEDNIRKRIELMFEKGLEKENKKLKKYNFIETIGYKEFEDYFNGQINREELKNQIYINTRKYAKRQLTWFKRNKDAIWISSYKEAWKECNKFLSESMK